MTALDIILLVAFIPSVIYGLKKGIVSMLITIVSLLLSIWVSYHFAGDVATWLGQWMEVTPVALKCASYIAIFLLVAAVMRTIQFFIEKLLEFAMLGWANRIFGALLGAIATGIVLGLCIMLFNTLNMHYHLVKDEALAACTVYNGLKDIAYTVFPFMKEMLL